LCTTVLAALLLTVASCARLLPGTQSHVNAYLAGPVPLKRDSPGDDSHPAVPGMGFSRTRSYDLPPPGPQLGDDRSQLIGVELVDALTNVRVPGV
jgi:hypothetical protein